MDISDDAFEGLYVGLSVGVGIVGFILVSLVTRWFMPAWDPLSEFGAFLWCAGWAAVWVIYVTLYVFAAICAFPRVERLVFGRSK